MGWMPGLVMRVCTPFFQEGQGRRISNSMLIWDADKIKASLGNKDTLTQNTKEEGAGL